MILNESDYNNGQNYEGKQVPNSNNGKTVTLALTLVKDSKEFLNSAGQKLDLVQPNQSDVYQQFVFGKDQDTTIINAKVNDGMVWDVADHYNLNPPEGTPFYLFPIHGRHNQHFLYNGGMIYAQQNGQVVTYVGGDVPLVMMAPSEKLKARQTFYISLL